MKRCSGWLLLVVLFLSSSCAIFVPQLSAQADQITIAAGTDEDHALQAISSEQDAQKKLAMYQEFVQKFSASPAAVAYGNWQLAQAYQATGDLQKSLDYGDKALAASPHNLQILVSQATVALQAKNNAKLMDYAATGGAICLSIRSRVLPDTASLESLSITRTRKTSSLVLQLRGHPASSMIKQCSAPGMASFPERRSLATWLPRSAISVSVYPLPRRSSAPRASPFPRRSRRRL